MCACLINAHKHVLGKLQQAEKKARLVSKILQLASKIPAALQNAHTAWCGLPPNARKTLRTFAPCAASADPALSNDRLPRPLRRRLVASRGPLQPLAQCARDTKRLQGVSDGFEHGGCSGGTRVEQPAYGRSTIAAPSWPAASHAHPASPTVRGAAAAIGCCRAWRVCQLRHVVDQEDAAQQAAAWQHHMEGDARLLLHQKREASGRGGGISGAGAAWRLRPWVPAREGVAACFTTYCMRAGKAQPSWGLPAPAAVPPRLRRGHGCTAGWRRCARCHPTAAAAQYCRTAAHYRSCSTCGGRVGRGSEIGWCTARVGGVRKRPPQKCGLAATAPAGLIPGVRSASPAACRCWQAATWPYAGALAQAAGARAQVE